jgi:hypothetical protein
MSLAAMGVPGETEGAARMRRGRRAPVRAAALLAIALAASLALACDAIDDEIGHLRDRVGKAMHEPEPLEPAPPPTTVRGRLALSLHGPGGAGPAVVHESTWVRGAGYDGMEDNDLRGFLDGRYIYGWNQPGQVHTRMGRRPTSPRWGETELYRTLQRWADVVLPAGAHVREAELALRVEYGRAHEVTAMLYAVGGDDWRPGRGGATRNNTSVPEPGDVWWGARAEGEVPWGLPGVGYAAPDPAADTPVTALAETSWEKGEDCCLVFRSAALAAYAERRATRGKPLLFLVKLSDVDEDTPGTEMGVVAASADDLHNTARRPHLTLTWEDPAPRARLVRDLHLEYGRRLALPRLDAGGARLAAASFVPDEGHEAPTILVRGGREGAPASAWRPLHATLPVDWRWMEARVVGARGPLVELGETFTTRLHDTWIRSAPPEEQAVPFTFVSPRGERTEVLAEYQGDYVWTVSFRPDALGRWRYAFESSFLDETERHPPATFDVVALERESVRRGLEALLARAQEEAEDGEAAGGISPLAQEFWKLERAAMRLETPARWRSEEGRRLRELFDAVREAISGRRIPDEVVPTDMPRDF